MPNKKWKDDNKIFDYQMKVRDNVSNCNIINTCSGVLGRKLTGGLWDLMVDFIVNSIQNNIEDIADEFK